MKIYSRIPRTYMIIEAADSGDLNVAIRWDSVGGSTHHTVAAIIETRHLVLAIKQIEEERDHAEGLPPRPAGGKTRSREHGGSLDRAIYAARFELGEMLRDPRFDSIHLAEIASAISAISRSTSPSEVFYIFDRLKETHTGPTRAETWRKPGDGVASKTEDALWPKGRIYFSTEEDPYHY